MYIEHAGLMADDPSQLAFWYQEHLYFSIFLSLAENGGPVFLSDEHGNLLEIFPKPKGFVYPDDESSRVSHLALAVDNFDETVTALEKAGVSLAAETVEIFGGGKVRFFQDPEGHWLHIVWRPNALKNKE